MRRLKISDERITQRSENINRYFIDVEKTPLLSSEDEFKVSKLAQAGDEEAVQKLIYANLRFVVSVAKQYYNGHLPLDELISQGNIGLCHAARTFDPSRGFKFITYAVWHIRKEIIHFLNSDSRVVRLPQNIITDFAKIKRIDEMFLQEEGRPGTLEEIQEELDKRGTKLSIDNIKKIILSDTKSIPLESNDPDDSFSPIDWIQHEAKTSEPINDKDFMTVLEVALSRLSSVQRDVVTRRFGIGQPHPETFSTIADIHGKTPEWARQMFVKSIKLMRLKLVSSRFTEDKIFTECD